MGIGSSDGVTAVPAIGEEREQPNATCQGDAGLFVFIGCTPTLR